MLDRIKSLDWEKWINNTLIFSAPFLLVFLVEIQRGTPIKQALAVVYLYALNVIVDLLRKFVANNPSK